MKNLQAIKKAHRASIKDRREFKKMWREFKLQKEVDEKSSINYLVQCGLDPLDAKNIVELESQMEEKILKGLQAQAIRSQKEKKKKILHSLGLTKRFKKTNIKT